MRYAQVTRIALLGQAIGDAFGAPFEYAKRAPEMAARSMAEGRYLDAVLDVGQPARWARLPGMYTDDTQQALVLLRAAALASDPLDAADVAAHFRTLIAEMYDAWVPGTHAGVHRGTGKNFRECVRTNKPVDTAGLGAAMRVGPAATLLPDLETLLPWMITVSRTTTTHPIALTSAAIFAAHCHAAAFGGEADLTDRLLSWLDTPAAHALGLERDAWLEPLRALAVLEASGEAELLKYAVESGLSNKELDCAANGFALTGLPWVLLHSRAANLPDALIGACSSGGDTDTVGAMVGCLAVLRLGGEALPPWMLSTLHGIELLREPERWEPVVSERLLTQREEGHRREALLREMDADRQRRRLAEEEAAASPLLSRRPWDLLDEEEDADADADVADDAAVDEDESFSDDPLSQLPAAPAAASEPAPLPPESSKVPARVEQLDLFGKPRT